jgi:hypothetical protein
LPARFPMTPHPPTPPASQHCDHEEICRFFFHDSKVAHRDGTSCMRNHEGCAKCTYDTRPLSAPASTLERQPCKYSAGDYCDTCTDNTCEFYPFVEHAAAISRAAADAATLAENTRVLDEIPISELHWSIGRIGYVIDHNECMRSELEGALVRITALTKTIEQLRRHALPQEERR